MEGIRNFWDCMNVFIDIEDPSDCLTSWTFLQDSRIDDLHIIKSPKIQPFRLRITADCFNLVEKIQSIKKLTQ